MERGASKSDLQRYPLNPKDSSSRQQYSHCTHSLAIHDKLGSDQAVNSTAPEEETIMQQAEGATAMKKEDKAMRASHEGQREEPMVCLWDHEHYKHQKYLRWFEAKYHKPEASGYDSDGVDRLSRLSRSELPQHLVEVANLSKQA